MAFVTAGFNYRLSGMRLHPSVVGKRADLEYQGHRCAIVIPAQLRNEEELAWHSFEDLAITSLAGARPSEYKTWAIRIEVAFDVPVVLGDDPQPEPSEDEKVQIISTASEVADSLLRKYLDHVRTRHHQTWLHTSETQHYAIGSADLISSSGEPLTHSSRNYGPPIVMLSGEPGMLSEASHLDIAQSISTGQDVSLADKLLADAHALAWPTPSPDYPKAVMIAAIACEVRVKAVLGKLASPQQAALVDVVLSNPRDVSVAAVDLNHVVLKAVCGRSLKEDDRALYNLVRRLFEDRNKVAHRGGSGLDAEAISGHVRVADRLFDYLRGVETEVLGSA